MVYIYLQHQRHKYWLAFEELLQQCIKCCVSQSNPHNLKLWDQELPERSLTTSVLC